MMTGWTMGLDAWLWMAAWVAVLFVVVWLLVREPRRPSHDDALDLLRARYARGELTDEEFERARRVLGV